MVVEKKSRPLLTKNQLNVFSKIHLNNNVFFLKARAHYCERVTLATIELVMAKGWFAVIRYHSNKIWTRESLFFEAFPHFSTSWWLLQVHCNIGISTSHGWTVCQGVVLVFKNLTSYHLWIYSEKEKRLLLKDVVQECVGVNNKVYLLVIEDWRRDSWKYELDLLSNSYGSRERYISNQKSRARSWQHGDEAHTRNAS